MCKILLNGFKISVLIIGTTIGAGFASGREIWEFFSSYGTKSFFGILVFMLLFGLCSVLIIWISYNFKTNNYYELLKILVGAKLAKIFDVIILTYLFSVSIVMFAGSGATFEHLGSSYYLGVFLLGVFVWIIIKQGITGLINVNQYIIPMLLFFLIYVTLQYNLHHSIYTNEYFRANLDVWPSAIIYSSLNIISLLAVLSTLGNKIESKGEIIVGGILSVVFLGLIAFLINNALLMVKDVNIYEIPLFTLIPSNIKVLLVLVSICLWLAIFSTVLSNVHGIVHRLQKKWYNLSRNKLSLGIVLCIIPFSFFGFSTLLNILYPIFGILNLYIMISILVFPFQNEKYINKSNSLKNKK